MRDGCGIVSFPRWGGGEGEMGGEGDKGTRRQGDKETRRQGGE
ncbi:hypothetical protein [Tolypothrix sp. VBCCA 56010]